MKNIKKMFENFGYFKEYYSENKFLGKVNHVVKDREIIGYEGRKKEVLSDRVVFDNGKIAKAGIEVMTILYPLNKQMIKL